MRDLETMSDMNGSGVQVSSYDNSQYGNYNQQPALKEFQPAPKYNASNAQSTAAHSAYNTHSHATGQTFGATAAGASTSAPLAAAAGAQQVTPQCTLSI